MKAKTLFILGGVVLILIFGSVWLYNWVLGDTLGASAPISAPTLEIATQPPATETPSEPTQQSPTEESSSESQTDSSTTVGLVIYQISQNESQVRFNIYEELRGSPKDVIGVSNQVAGEIAVDSSDLGSAQISVIQINARTLETDDDRRNRAIRNRILFTDQFEFITFEPTEISGLSGPAQSGVTYTFQIAGNLTIRDITQPVVFEVSAMAESPERITGIATTTINRGDFNLIVPDLDFIANVGEEVILEINFVLIGN